MKKIALERKYTNHICAEMEISKPMRTIRVFEKNINGYGGNSQKIIEFEITEREFFGKRIFREVD